MRKKTLLSVLAVAASTCGVCLGQKDIAFATVQEASTKEEEPMASSKSKVTITIEDNGRTTTRIFEIPSSTLKAAEPVLEWAGFEIGDSDKSNNNIQGTYLGVMLDESGESSTGVKLSGVLENSPAARAGLQKGDVLKKMDDQQLINPPQLTALIRARKDGDKVSLTYERGDKTHLAEVTLAARETASDVSNLKKLSSALAKISGGDLDIDNIDLLKTGKEFMLNIPPGVEFLRGNVIRFGKEGEVVVEELKNAAEAASNSAAKSLAAIAGKQQDLNEKRNQGIEDLKGRLAELRDTWAKAQEKQTQEQAEVMKQLRDELQKANEAARQALEEARQALEKVKQQNSPTPAE